MSAVRTKCCDDTASVLCGDCPRAPLRQLEAICAEIYGRWDKDMRSGKLLQALAGTLPKYRADVDSVRAALAVAPKAPVVCEEYREALSRAIKARLMAYEHYDERPHSAALMAMDIVEQAICPFLELYVDPALAAAPKEQN